VKDNTSTLLHLSPFHHDILASDMVAVDKVIQHQLQSDVALVGQIGHYIVHAGGKRIRPRLVLLMARAWGYMGDFAHTLAATVEFIHTATLLHDDVVDESTLRRGKPTANDLFGNSASVLVGDFLYSRAFQMMVSVNSMRVLDVMADATNVIAEGEVLQLMNMHNPDILVDDYLRVIRYKTAKLFEASARLGAVIAQVPYESEEASAAIGGALGTAFQLVDDLLDYEGKTEDLGKNVGDDLREGKATLPLLAAMQLGRASEREFIRQAIQNGNVDQLHEVIAIVQATGALDKTREAIAMQIQSAQEFIERLPTSIYQQALSQLCLWSGLRAH
jgi:octaprenyl-diphosphate synthase